MIESDRVVTEDVTESWPRGDGAVGGQRGLADEGRAGVR